MNQKSKGSVLIAMSALFYSSYGVWSKLMMGVFSEFNQAYIRALILLLILVPFGMLTKKFKKIEKKDRIWFLVISLGGLNQAPYYYGFKYLNVGTAVLLFYAMLTVGAYVIGKLFFGEKIGLVKYISLVLAVLGIGIIYSFSLSGNEVISALLVSVAGLMGSMVVVFSKKISGNYSETQILSSVFGAMLVGNLIFSLVFREGLPVISSAIPVLAQLGYTGAMLIANMAVVAGYKYLEPSVGALIGLLEVIFGAILGIVLFGEVMTIQTIIGSVIILGAIALPDLVSLRKRKETIS